MTFLQITDLHFVPPGETLFGLDPAARFAEVAALANRDHGDADFALITGDLAHRGERAAYEAVAEALAGLNMPARLMVGNHDARGPLRDVFPDLADADGFVQFAVEVGEMRLICLDTLRAAPGDSGGELCRARLDWLAAELAALPEGRDWLLAMHHPPMALGLPNMDRIRLNDAEALWEVIGPRPPRMMLLGHVHRPINGVWRGAPFHVQRGVNHQVAWDDRLAERLSFTDAPAALGVIAASGGDVLIHSRELVPGVRVVN